MVAGAGNIPWTADEEARLVVHIQSGTPFNMIPPREFPGRTSSAVRTRASLIANDRVVIGRQDPNMDRSDAGGMCGAEILGADALREDAAHGSRRLLIALVAYARKYHRDSDLARLVVA